MISSTQRSVGEYAPYELMSLWSKKLRWPSMVAIICIIVAIPIGLRLYFYYTEVRIPTDPDAITDAIYHNEPWRNSTQDEICDAIERLHQPSAFSPKNQCSLLYAAATSDRDRVFEWLLKNGADPNTPRRNPLLACIISGNTMHDKRLVLAGARWDFEVEPGRTVRHAAEERNPSLMKRLLP